MGNTKSIAERRREHEEKAQELRRREAESAAADLLAKDATHKRLERAAQKARRNLQLNRLGQAQKERSIRTMEEKIKQTREDIIPLANAEGPLDEIRERAERELKEYRQNAVQRAMRDIT